MKKFFGVILAVLIFLSSSVLGFSIVVPVDEKHFLYSFDVGGGNIVFPLSSDSIYNKSEEAQESVNNFLSLLSNPNYIVVFSFNTVNIVYSGNCSIGVFEKDSFYISEDTYSGQKRYNAASKNNSFYRASFSYNSKLKLFELSTPYLASGGGIPLSTGVWQCWSPSLSFAEHDVIKFLDINSISFSGYSPPVIGYTLTVNYLYSDDNPAADPVTQTLAAGEAYSIPSPEITGYTPSLPVVSSTMPEEDLTVNIYYAMAFYDLKVKYQYPDGTEAAPEISYQYPAGFVYDVPSPAIAGYRPDKSSVTGEMPGEAVTETVIYSPVPYTLTVNYQYADGSRAAEPHRQQLYKGDSYSVPSPEITGYHPNQSAVTGVMPAEDVVATVTYREDTGGSGGPDPVGPGGGGGSGGGGEGPGGGGDDPFIPTLPPSSGYDPFVVQQLPLYSGSDPFSVGAPPPFTGYDPFIIRQPPPWSGYDPFAMPDKLGG